MEQNQKPVKAPAKNRKNTKSTAFALLMAALALAIAIPLNLLASRLDIIWDMTPSNMYELTDTTKNYLSTLDKQVDFYFLMDMDKLSTDTSSMALYHSLEQYAACDKINFVGFDPNSDPELVRELQEKGGFKLKEGDMVIHCEDRYRRVPGYNMYRENYSTTESGTQVREATYFTGENFITGAIDAVVSGRDTVIYFLTGHGEKQIEADYTKLRSNLNDRNYQALPLDLAMVDAVPDNAAILIFAAPKQDISNDDLRKINNYLDGGGNICFWMSPNEEVLRYKNIDSVLEDFGLAMDYDIVRETDDSLHISGDPYTFLCTIVRSEEEIDLTSGVADMANNGIRCFMSNTRSFYPYLVDASAKDTSVVTGSLLQTYANGTDVMGNSVSSAVGEVCGDTNPSAVNIENQVLDLAMYSTSTRRNGAKIMVMGNAEFIDDTNVEQDYMIIPVNLALSVFSWMYDSDVDLDMGIADKERGYDSFRLNSEKAANTANIVFIAVPLGVALVGVGVWLKRRYA